MKKQSRVREGERHVRRKYISTKKTGDLCWMVTDYILTLENTHNKTHRKLEAIDTCSFYYAFINDIDCKVLDVNPKQ